MKQLFSVLVATALTGSLLTSCGDGVKDGDKDGDSTAFENTSRDRGYADSTTNTANTTTLSNNDGDLVKDLVESNYEEIKLAQLASQKSSNAEVKEIAKMLEADHTAALDKLKQVAGNANLTVATGEDDDARDEIKKLSDETGKEFDKDWCKKMMDKHDKTINKLEKEQNDVTDPAVKSWIAENLPKIRTHHDKLMACHSKMK
jgi:putative membrane protein